MKKAGWVEKGGRAGLLKKEKVITSLLLDVSMFKQHTGHQKARGAHTALPCPVVKESH